MCCGYARTQGDQFNNEDGSETNLIWIGLFLNFELVDVVQSMEWQVQSFQPFICPCAKVEFISTLLKRVENRRREEQCGEGKRKKANKASRTWRWPSCPFLRAVPCRIFTQLAKGLGKASSHFLLLFHRCLLLSVSVSFIFRHSPFASRHQAIDSLSSHSVVSFSLRLRAERVSLYRGE